MRPNAKLLVAFLAVAIVVDLGLSFAAGEGNWPCWQGPNHDNKSSDTGLLKQWPEGGPPKLWQVSGIGQGFSSVAVSGGMVYITGQDETQLWLFAFDMNGHPKWKQAVDKAWTKNYPGARGSATIDAGKAYVLSGNGLLACLDARSGQPLWSVSASQFDGRPGGWGYAETPLVVGEKVIFKPGKAKCVVALNKATGETIWSSTGFDAGPEYSSCLPVAFGGAGMIVTGTKGGLVAFSTGTGRMMWSNSFCAGNTANCPTPAYADGHVFWANGYGKGGICMQLSGAGEAVTATEAWQTSDMICHHGGYVIDKGFIYGNHQSGWSCLDLKTGQVKWNDKGVGKGSLTWADGMLYLFSLRDGLAGLATCTPDGLTMKGTFSVAGKGPSWAYPVVTGGRLYLRYDDNLYCFDVMVK